MRLDMTIAGVAAATLTNVTRLEIDGTLYVPPGALPPDPVAPATPELAPGYTPSLKLIEAVKAAKCGWQVFCDSDGGPNDPPKLEGSGEGLPAIRYGSLPNSEEVVVMNPEHPYFKAHGIDTSQMAAMVAAVPMMHEMVKADKVATEPAGDAEPVLFKAWDTAESTLPPGEMSFLICWMGYTVAGKTPLQQCLFYRKWYYTRYGRQAPGGPVNREGLTDAQIAAIIAS